MPMPPVVQSRLRRPVRSLAAACLLAAALGVAGCGGSSAPATGTGGHATPAKSGAQVFSSAGCGNCHTLAAAHASGSVGPNLDDVKPSAAKVAKQVTDGGGIMPSFAGQLSKAQIAAVAHYVAKVAGQ